MQVIEVAPATALRFANALWRARGPHVARLMDLESAPDGMVRVAFEPGGVALADLLARGLEFGEAVTVLVPLAECVVSLGRAGVVHGGIAVSVVAFDERGAPILHGFEAARLGAEQAGLDAAVDLAAYGVLAREVLAAVTDAADSRDELLAELEPAPSAGGLLAFAERLLATAEPTPVRLGGRRPGAGPAPAAPGPIPPATQLGRAWVARWRGLRARPVWLAFRGLRSVRARFWVPGVLAVLGLVGAVVLIPAEAATPGADAPTDPLRIAPTISPASSVAPIVPQLHDDPLDAVRGLRSDVDDALVVDDYGDVVLIRVTTATGSEDVLLERTEAGWRLREMLSPDG